MRTVITAVAGAALAVAGALGVRRRRAAGATGRRRGDDDGGGTAGDREPRVPLPTVLSSAGAAAPGD